MDTRQPLIRLRNITRQFMNGDQPVNILKGIDLDIHQGEFIAIMGSSGSGKSTLMNLLGCLDKPTSGQYLLAGRDVSTMSSNELADLRRQVFGFIFQSYHLLPGTPAIHNVELPAIYAGLPSEERHHRARQLLQQLNLGDRIHHLPSQLSGGQQQRVSIARALMNGGEILLADEPTGALDSHSSAEVMQLLKELSQQGRTLILITHDPEVAAHADRVVIMKDGLLVEDQRKTATTPAETRQIRLSSQPPALWRQVLEAVKAGMQALRRQVFRTLLTLLGIMIGVASVIAMLAIGDGARHEIVDRISSMGSNLLLVRPGTSGSFGRSNINSLVPEDMYAIRAEVDNLLAVVPEQNGSTTLRYGNLDTTTQITATSSDFPRARQWTVAQGSFFTEQDERTYATVVVLGSQVAEQLFGDRSPLGEYIMANGLLLQVIGVMESRGASPMGQDQDDLVFLPYTTAGLRIFGRTNLRTITVAVEDVSRMQETQDDIFNLLLARHGIEDFQIRNMASLIDSVSETQNTFTLLLGSVAAISLLVGGIGVMNIMLVSVTERTREIGIRLAVGARTANILQQFLVEALVISALGGLLGVIIGLSTAQLVGYLGTPIYLSLGPVILAFSCAFLTGLIFGFLPARKAALLDPVKALATE